MGDEEVQVHITITLKEYKELLEIKGRYEELKKFYEPVTIYSGIKEGITVCSGRRNNTYTFTIEER